MAVVAALIALGHLTVRSRFPMWLAFAVVAASVQLAGADTEPAGPAAPDVTPFVSPDFENPRLSPDGKYVAVRRIVDDRPLVDVYTLGSSDSLGAFRLEEGFGIGDHAWGDSRTLIILGFRSDPYWTRGMAVDPTWFRYDIHDRKSERLFVNMPRRLLSMRNVVGKFRFQSFFQPLVPNAFADDPNDVLVLFPDDRSSWVSRYDVRRNRSTKLATIAGEVLDAYADRDGNVLAASGHPVSVGSRFEDQVQLWHRPSGDVDFQVAHTGHIDDYDIDLLAPGPRERTLYVLENVTGPSLGLGVLDLATGEVAAAFRPGRTDVMTAYLDRERSLYAVRYDDHFPQFHYPDPTHPAAVLHRFATGVFKDMNVEIVDFARDAPTAILDVRSDTEPGTYYLATLGETKLSTLFQRAPKPEAPGVRHPIEFAAQDGTRLTGYITVPPKYAEGEAAPFVVLVPSPFAPPASWGYVEGAQLLATNGLGVLEVNVRGALGFGRAFHEAALGKVMDTALADLAAGVEYVVANGIADPRRICIVGQDVAASVAMLASLGRPSRYRCVVTIAGTYDLAQLRKQMPLGGLRERFSEQIAGAGADDDAFRAISPRYLADRIDAPLLLVEAAQFVPSLSPQARGMIRALKAANVPYELHEESTTRTNRMLTHAARRGAYARIVGFLGEHLGVPVAVAEGDAQQQAP